MEKMNKLIYLLQTGVVETDADYEAIDQDNRTQKLEGMLERDRMEYYVSYFVKLIEEKKYQKAYELLYDEYKKNYFPNEAKFEEYCQKHFSIMMNLEFTNIERTGEYYIILVNVQDMISGKSNEFDEYSFVVRENKINDIDLSFSVKGEE